MKHGFVKVAMITPKLVSGLVKENTSTIKNAIRRACKLGAEICVLGADSLYGGVSSSLFNHIDFTKAHNEAFSDIVKFSKAVKCLIAIGSTKLSDDHSDIEKFEAFIHAGEAVGMFFEDDKSKKIMVSLDNRFFVLGFEETILLSKGLNLCLRNTSQLIYSNKERCEISKVITKEEKCGLVYISNTSKDKIAAENGQILQSSESDLEEIVFAEFDLDHFQEDDNPDGLEIVELSCSNAKLSRQYSSLPFVPDTNEFERIFDIIARGIYAKMNEAKTEKLILGLSGGLDSTFTLLCAVKAAYKYGFPVNKILAVMLPASSSSERTKTNARALCSILGVDKIEIDIEEMVKTHLEKIGHNSKNDVVYENAQARKRTHIILDLANKHNALMLGTSDLSEIALGWSTFGGDQVAHFNPNSGATKTLIRAMVRHHLLTVDDKDLASVLNDILHTPISPELLKNQDTEKINGPYELHDFFLYHLIFCRLPLSKVVFLAAQTFSYTKADILKYLRIFITRFFTHQFKRLASCEGIPLTYFDLSYENIPSELEGKVFLEQLEKEEF